MSPSFNDTIAEPNRPAPQVDIPDEFKQNLRQVLQTLETQLRGDMELEEALARHRSREPAGVEAPAVLALLKVTT